MMTNNSDKLDKWAWERAHVQRVLDYHNSKYSTNIEIKGKTEEVYPELMEKSNWDWVCNDTGSHKEIAIELKKITDAKSEEKNNIIWQLLEEIQDHFKGKLPGNYSLSIDIPQDYYLPFTEKMNKQEFQRVLRNIINTNVKKLSVGESIDIEPIIKRKISFSLPDISPIHLYKIDDEGSDLYKSSGITGCGSISFTDDELKELMKIVIKANKQLNVAKKNVTDVETMLILIEEGYRPKDPPEITEALKKLGTDSYSDIDRIYFIRSDEIADISINSH